MKRVWGGGRGWGKEERGPHYRPLLPASPRPPPRAGAHAGRGPSVMMRERKSAAVVRRGGKRARGPAALRRGSGAPSGAGRAPQPTFCVHVLCFLLVCFH